MDKARMRECIDFYISKGWRVMPLCYPVDGKCTCGRHDAFVAGTYKKGDCKAGKAPHFILTKNGSIGATINPGDINGWFNSPHHFNIGICAGKDSNLVILDIDPEHGGNESIKQFNPDQTATVTTGSGGTHLYYTHPGSDIRNSQGTLAPGLDVRGYNGYVVAPPSLHPCGKEYRWTVDPKAIIVCPAWIQNSKKRTATSIGDTIPEGERNGSLTSLAGRMRRAAASEDEIYAALAAFNDSRCRPPLDDGELRTIAGSVGRYEPKKTKEIILTDDRPTTVAVKFEELSEVSHHYNSIDEWSIYSKNQYQQVRDYKEIETHLLRFLSKCIVSKRRKDKDGWEEYTEKLKKQSGGYIRDVMRALRSMRSVHILPSMKAPSSFSGALNPDTTIAMANGLLDISDAQNPQMNAFTPDFYTFNYLPIEYDPSRKCPLWEGPCMGFYFTNEDGSPDTIALDVMYSWQKRFVLRRVNPHKIFALIGDPRSGKSTAGRVIQAIIGARNCTALTIASLSGPHGMHSLMNKQLGIMWDAQVAGRSQDVARSVQAIKMISGQDPIQINPKCKDTIDLDSLPLNILMIANKPADLKDDTGVLATRFSFLHTTQSFLGKEDPTLEARIMDHELPGIFNKILAAPDTIVEHPKSAGMVQDYAEMTSPYTAFANDRCEVDPENFIPTDILWAYYCVWCDKFNHKKPSAQTFKINFSSAIRGVEKKQRRLTDNVIEELSAFHRLSQQGEPPLKIAQRPHCFVGIDIINDYRGQWPSYPEGKRLGYGLT